VPGAVVEVTYLLLAPLHARSVVDFIALLASIEILRYGFEIFTILFNKRHSLINLDQTRRRFNRIITCLRALKKICCSILFHVSGRCFSFLLTVTAAVAAVGGSTFDVDTLEPDVVAWPPLLTTTFDDKVAPLLPPPELVGNDHELASSAFLLFFLKQASSIEYCFSSSELAGFVHLDVAVAFDSASVLFPPTPSDESMVNC
jgi:hypothetical protein